MAVEYINLDGVEIDGKRQIKMVSITDPDAKPDKCSRCFIGAKNECSETCPFYEFRESK